MTAALLAGVWVLAVLVTGLVRRYALRNEVLDLPNERSSHTVPTPRGGGLGIVTAALVGFCGAWALGWIPLRLLLALCGGGGLLAAIGWIDDHRPVSVRLRLVFQFMAAFWAIAWLGGLPALRLGPVDLPLGLAGWLIGAVGLVWLVNLYNFMDGIDGLAAGEAVLVGTAAALLAWNSVGIGVAAAIVSAASLGFLFWNWPPARIFLGDVGSGFIGFCLGTLAIASGRAGGPPLLLWLVLLAAFIVDATLTLLRRVVRGEAWASAHRLHAYQRAVQSGMSHAQVTARVLLLGGVLVTIAAAAAHSPWLTGAAVVAALLVVGLAYGWVERRRPM